MCPLPVAVFASGAGTNLQALLDHEETGAAYHVAVVISNRQDAGALERARSAGRAARVISVKDRAPEDVGEETLRALEDGDVQVILLAGYLRMLPPSVVAAYPRRILNVHPALLPAFGGRGMYGHHVHEAVLASGAKVTGVTVHYVDEQYDTGAIVAQWPVPVHPGDDAGTVAARVREVEHRLYAAVVDHVCRALASGTEPPPFRAPSRHFDAPVTQRLSDLGYAIRAGFPARAHDSDSPEETE